MTQYWKQLRSQPVKPRADERATVRESSHKLIFMAPPAPAAAAAACWKRTSLPITFDEPLTPVAHVAIARREIEK